MFDRPASQPGIFSGGVRELVLMAHCHIYIYYIYTSVNLSIYIDTNVELVASSSDGSVVLNGVLVKQFWSRRWSLCKTILVATTVNQHEQ